MSLDGVVATLFPIKAQDENSGQLTAGIITEIERGLERKQAEKVASDHLIENPNYYNEQKVNDSYILTSQNNDMSKSASQIFVLDDDQDRIDLFKQAFGSQNVVVTSNVKNTLNLLRSYKFAKIFLDRDLSSNIENGEDVAWQMKQEQLCQETPVVIHSENTRGQRVMAKYLGSYHNNVTVTPFRQLKKQLDIPGGIQLTQNNKQTTAGSVADTKCPHCGVIGVQNSECKFCHKHIPGKQIAPDKELWNQPENSQFEPSWEKRKRKNELLNLEKRTASTKE